MLVPYGFEATKGMHGTYGSSSRVPGHHPMPLGGIYQLLKLSSHLLTRRIRLTVDVRIGSPQHFPRGANGLFRALLFVHFRSSHRDGTT